MAEKLNLKDIKVLSPKTGMLTKLVTFAPTTHIEKLQEALFAVGGGNIGNYSSCSFRIRERNFQSRRRLPSVLWRNRRNTL